MWTIEKDHTVSEDCYVSVKFDGVVVLMTLWLGESNITLIDMAQKIKASKNA